MNRVALPLAIVLFLLSTAGLIAPRLAVPAVRSKIEAIPTIAEADVELTFDPPWNHSMMSDVAKLETGMM